MQSIHCTSLGLRRCVYGCFFLLFVLWGDEHREEAIEREWKPLCVMEMSIEHMTGKEAIELVRRRDTKA